MLISPYCVCPLVDGLLLDFCIGNDICFICHLLVHDVLALYLVEGFIYKLI